MSAKKWKGLTQELIDYEESSQRTTNILFIIILIALFIITMILIWK